MTQSTTYDVDGGKIRIHRAQHSYYWSWIDERGRRLSDYRSGYLSCQDCIADAKREMSAIAEPDTIPWWVGN